MSDPKAKRRVAARKRCTKNMELTLLQTLRLFHLVQFVKCCQFFSGDTFLKTVSKIRKRKSK